MTAVLDFVEDPVSRYISFVTTKTNQTARMRENDESSLVAHVRRYVFLALLLYGDRKISSFISSKCIYFSLDH